MFQLCEMNTRETVPKHSLFRFGVQLKRAFVGDNATRCHQSNNRKANSEQAKRRARWNNCPMFYCSNGSHKIVLACGVLKVDNVNRHGILLEVVQVLTDTNFIFAKLT
ncbi:hypothetical protein HanHA300_Chr06g0208341 [Helianthus annuus]|nr:hypothetical protein HanHA300_Chr06g0208341 [Helianthus annuus]KAJ0573150.1 hypothetical protein HanHA89_Chr06g0223641 [Helianthus annuus]KAJ0737570.1 hypothetical protein HanLR1_Chr06g0208511 [Helianthus annuus]KAJ0740447.1 hypothetical protein HanOQP8_Chr06g0216951 [Helianthus annuus]